MESCRGNGSEGLSPHIRGKHRDTWEESDGQRSIPAYTGETVEADVALSVRRVYPRIYGGNPPPANMPSKNSGLSPHIRGKLFGVMRWMAPIRSIPAYTGETKNSPPRPPPGEVYPRIYGGNNRSWNSSSGCKGLSPHIRGKLVRILYLHK